MNMMQKILKGDTSGQVSLALADGFDYTDVTVEVIYQGAVRQFKNCAAGQTIQFAFTAAETAPMALGVFPVTVRIGKPDGTLITVANAGVKIAVTDCIGEVRAGSVIAVDAHGGLYGVDDLPANYTIKDLRAKINEIITKLGGGVAALCLLACTAFGAGVNVQKAALEDIPNGAQVVTNATVDLTGIATVTQLHDASNNVLTASKNYTDNAVQQAGSMMPEIATNIAGRVVTNLVPSWARSDTPPITQETDPNVPGWIKGKTYGFFNWDSPPYKKSEVDSLLSKKATGWIEEGLIRQIYSSGNTKFNFIIESSDKQIGDVPITTGTTYFVTEKIYTWNGGSSYSYQYDVNHTGVIAVNDSNGKSIHFENGCYVYRPNGSSMTYIHCGVSRVFELVIKEQYCQTHKIDSRLIGIGKVNGKNFANGDITLNGNDIPMHGGTTNSIYSTFTSTIQYIISNPPEESDPTVPSWAKESNKPTYTAAEVGAASSAELSTVSGNANQALLYSSGIYQYMIGNTNAWLEGTNYVTTADAANRTRFAWEQGMDAGTVPCSMALREIRDGNRNVVWDQRDWTVWYWNFKSAQLSNNLAAVTHVVSEEVRTNCMKRGFAKYTAVQGLDNPATDTLWIDTPKVQLMAGHQWEKLITVGGAGYYTLTGNGIELSAADTTNTFLTIKDFEGNACLTFRKTSSYLVYCECGTDITGNYHDNQGRVVLHFTTDVQPTGEFSTTLDLDDFVGQGEDGCPANYEWTGSAGSWDCHFKLKDGIVSTSCFARFKIQREGENVVEHTVPIKLDGGIVFTQNGTQYKIKPSISGGNVVWSIVQ